jgi:ankyrin repeat protein
LHWAIKHGRLAIVKELLAGGANPNAKTKIAKAKMAKTKMAKCH